MSRPMGSIGEYAVTSKLGSGSFAVVYRGFHKKTKVPVAIKAISLAKLNRKLLANLESEIAIMKQIDHPNIVKLYDLKKTDKHIYLILEFCAGGDLQQFVKRQQAAASPPTSTGSGQKGNFPSTTTSSTSSTPSPLSEQVAQHFLRELAKGLKCLWTQNLIHRDLKPQNLLLASNASDSVLKIADFGFARHLAETSMAETLCGSPLYMAPEILKFQKYDAKADLWSVGTILYEMVVGKPPFGGANHVQLLANIERQELRFPRHVTLSNECKDLLKGLLRRNPLVRISFDEFFQHPFVALASLSPEVPLPSSSSATSSPSSLPVGSDAGPTSPLIAESPRRKRSLDGAPPPAPLAPTSSLTSAVAGAPMEIVPTAPMSAPPLNKPAMTDLPGGSGRKLVSNPMPRARRSISGGLPSTSSTPTTTTKRTDGLRLTPQMTSDGGALVTPSPRINPFKPLSESPPGAAALLSSSMSSTGLRKSRSSLTKTSSSKQPPSAPLSQQQHQQYDTDEYVLVEPDKSPSPPPVGAGTSSTPPVKSSKPPLRRSNSGDNSKKSSGSNALHPSNSSPRDVSSVSPRAAPAPSVEDLDTVHIMLYRIEAIAPIADSLYRTSLTHGGAVGFEEGGSCLSSNLLTSPQAFSSTMLSMSSSTSSGTSSCSLSPDHRLSRSSYEEEKALQQQIVASTHAFLLYVKCMRLIEHAIHHFKAWTSSSSSSMQHPAQQWTHARANAGGAGSKAGAKEVEDKVSLASLTEQLSFFLERAEECKKRMNLCLLEQERACSSALSANDKHADLQTSGNSNNSNSQSNSYRTNRSAGGGCLSTTLGLAKTSVEEILYNHALRLSKDGAVKEVLGQTVVAHDLYIQAMLLLETLVMEESVGLRKNMGGSSSSTSSSSRAGTRPLGKDDLDRIARFISGLEGRICSVQQTLSTRPSALHSLPEAG